MGDYRIVIEGHGVHDNGNADDADNQAVRFRDHLRTLGHEVTYVGFGLHTGPRVSPMVQMRMRDLTSAELAHAAGPERYSDSVAADEGATDSIL